MAEESFHRVVHQRQSRQLCAVHALNNLLQLNVDDTDGSASHECMYQCGPFTAVLRSCNLVTKVEMDQIADYLTFLENNLLLAVAEGGLSSPEESPQEPSLKEKLVSNHRTMWLGCYSFECVELCLKKRGVKLEWYRLPNDDPKNNYSAALEKNVEPDQIVCGFIINLGEGGGLSNIWNPLRYVPLLGRVIHVGRHWLSVTRLRRRDQSSSTSISSEARDGREEGGWLVIDSDRQDIVELCNDELVEYLKSIQRRGGQTFRATINLS